LIWSPLLEAARAGPLATAQTGLLAPARVDLPSASAATLAAASAETPTASDGRRTNDEFVKNLGRNAVGLYDHDNVGPFLIGAAATGAATFFDDDCHRFFGSERRAKWLGDFADRLGRPYVIGPLAGVLYGLGRSSDDHPRFRAWTYDIAQVTLISAAYTEAIKYATHRVRPDSSDHHSYPSGHTSNAFAWATIANHYGGSRLGVPAFLFAGLIGVGRMEKNVHYLSDVVGGATLGYLVARTVIREDDDSPAGAAPAAGPGARPAARARPIVRVSFVF
jgi:membrane-associated phospholipid phosphatase